MTIFLLTIAGRNLDLTIFYHRSYARNDDIVDPRQDRLFDPYQGVLPPAGQRIITEGWQGVSAMPSSN